MSSESIDMVPCHRYRGHQGHLVLSAIGRLQ